MKAIARNALIAVSALCLAAGATAQAQTKEIRVLLANHPYGELLKAAIPEFEQATGIKVNVESLQESQLTTKLTTEFATNSSSVDVFMTRPLQEGKMFYKNGWYEPLAELRLLGFSEERHERRAPSGPRPTSCRSSPSGRCCTTARTSSQKAGIKPPDHLRRAGSRGEEAE